MKSEIYLQKTFYLRIIVLLCAALMFSQIILAQEEQSRFKGKAPVSKEPLKVQFPKAKEATLKNGLRIVMIEGYSSVPTFSMQMIILSGGLSDPADQRGLAGFTAAMLREGTTKRTGSQISELVDSLGATLGANSSTSAMTTTIFTSGLAESFDPALDLFADVIRNPKFDKSDFEKYSTRTASQIQLQRSNPLYLSIEQFHKAAYGQHPAAFYSLPVESLKKITVEDLARFHATHYMPNNTILAIVGDTTLKEVLPKIERAFGDWKRGYAPKLTVPAAQSQVANIRLIDRPGSVQTAMSLGGLGIELTDPDYFAMLVMDRLMGGGTASRLFMNLRESKGYTYSIYSLLGGSKFRGTWRISTQFGIDSTEGTLKEIAREIKRIREERVSETELENAKRSVVSSFALSLEQPNTIIQNIFTEKLYNLPPNYWNTYAQKVASVTADDVMRVANKYVDMSRFQIVAVGDVSKIRGAMEKYGVVEVYDVDGKPVKSSGN
jgi:predicted Zn-dependent peptidase